ncbi:MAG: imelysin family protein [Crocinitomicaceae bacterium]
MKKILFLLLISLTFACKKTEPVPHEEVLRDLSSNLLRPNHETFNNDVDSLFYYVQEIHNQNFDPYNIQKVKEYFSSVLFSWNNINFFETEAIATTYIHFRIHKWPVDSAYILATTQSTTTIDSSLIVNQSSRRKGLSALEYLLFREHAFDTLQVSSQSREYLFQTTSILKNHKDRLKSMWEATEYSNFENNEGSGVYTASNFFYNNYVLKLELMLHEKLGIPSGLDQNTTLDLNMVESNFALQSLAILRQDILIMLRVFEGYNGKGLADICRSNGGENTANLILEKWYSILQKVNALQSINLRNAILNESAAIQTIYLELKSLLSYIKYDLPQFMSATLLYSSNDGD